jgi:hypothetical protein
MHKRKSVRILELNIVKLSSGIYEAHCDGELAGASVHNSIAAALRHYGTDIPAEFAKFVNVEYAGVRLATTSITSLDKDAERLASELVQMVAEIHYET